MVREVGGAGEGPLQEILDPLVVRDLHCPPWPLGVLGHLHPLVFLVFQRLPCYPALMAAFMKCGVYMCKCVCVCSHVYVHVFTCVCTCVCSHVYVHVYVHMCMYMCSRVYGHVYVHVCIRTSGPRGPGSPGMPGEPSLPGSPCR